MLYLYTGTDREKARAAMQAAIKKISGKHTNVVRITDANVIADLEVVLRGRGMFESERTLVLEGIFTNDEMRPVLETSIEALAQSEENVFIFEEKPDAATRRLLGKYTKSSETFDAPKAEREDNFFAVTGAFRAGKKKELWVLLQREYALGKAPEMLHGSLFWAAKQMVLKPRGVSDAVRGKKLVAQLAALPHESRRRGEDLEYALERFVLSGV
jgi:hypothetical protein